ncbi:hypothetical protein HanXRQr2_Chr15g0705191 [Helianthus annuus]|uniref:Uncharacterized protein n=1 Tax=Helianthus annuus TaxID=4232 RepID=A0A9K3E211_HELAN|nr:hypothetical protein HanXRQr2_Chr15g0705191 [Helianthus annuus]KAJ0456830.1 hypothetical protein HanIR_Chr15g0766921 [Helianthus annuus]KAJ0832262.1 hypothetical protein HanPSC8_Chr15g0676751 [Helianthus annuus]
MFTSSVGMGGNFKNFSKMSCFKSDLKAQVTKSTWDGTTHVVFCHDQVQINSMTGI